MLSILLIVESFRETPKEDTYEIILTPSPTPQPSPVVSIAVVKEPTPMPTPEITPEEIVIIEQPIVEEPLEIAYIEEAPPVIETPVVIVPVYDQGSSQQMICNTFGPYCQDALIIVQHESGFNSSAVSPTDDHGLFQINAYWQRDKYGSLNELYDPATNIAIAWQIFTGRGNSWSAWYTCKYLPSCY